VYAMMLTQSAISSNYGGEEPGTCQKISIRGQDYFIISSVSLRNCLREYWIINGIPSNRRRLLTAENPKVMFQSMPDPQRFIDDCLLGYMVVRKEDKTEKGKGRNRKNRKGNGQEDLGAEQGNGTIPTNGEEVSQETEEPAEVPEGAETAPGRTQKPAKRRSPFQISDAVALQPYQGDELFFQSPDSDMTAGSAYKNAETTALLNRERSHTGDYFSAALRGSDLEPVPHRRAWVESLFEGLTELTPGGNQTRTPYPFSLESVLLRLTPCLCPQWETPLFDQDGGVLFLEKTFFLEGGETYFPPNALWLRGKILTLLPAHVLDLLKGYGAHMHRNPNALLKQAARAFNHGIEEVETAEAEGGEAGLVWAASRTSMVVCSVGQRRRLRGRRTPCGLSIYASI